jgi:hypothetical protein
MKLIKIFSLSFFLLMVAACDKLGDDLLNNPNVPTPETADINLTFNEVQLNFRNFYNNISDFGAQLTRMQHMFGPLYGNAYTNVSFNTPWYNAYVGVFKNADALIPVAEKSKLTAQVGAVKVMKAYTLMVLVDNFGDIPFSQANNPDITNPKLDAGKDVYDGAIKLLDEAIADLNKVPSANPSNDLFYGPYTNADASNAASVAVRKKWITLAKTLKLRAYSTTRLVDAGAKGKIDALLTENDLIDTDAEDFAFRYGTKLENPDSRHPKYNDGYQQGNGGSALYQSNHFLWSLRKEKGVDDPRLRFYFYRQTLNYNYDAFTIPCRAQNRPAHYPAQSSFCIVDLGDGYWGRDHGDGSGIPPDNPTRTAWGVYPCGGQFDENQGVKSLAGQGGRGQGVLPIWMSCFTEFVKAECALTIGTAGTPKTLLESAVRKSINRVITFPATVGLTVPANRLPSADSITAYVTRVNALWDAASTNDAKLNVLIKEYRLAAFGNGLEIYNAYRRTGKPDNFQLTLAPDPGKFILSFPYPAEVVNFNKTIQAKPADNSKKVFWDNTSFNLK